MLKAQSTSGKLKRVLVNDEGYLLAVLVSGVTIDPGDIKIGAIEIQDSETGDRVTVKTDGTDIALTARINNLGSMLPYGADEQVISFTDETEAKIDTIVFMKAGVVLKTRTFNYSGLGNYTGTVDA